MLRRQGWGVRVYVRWGRREGTGAVNESVLCVHLDAPRVSGGAGGGEGGLRRLRC